MQSDWAAMAMKEEMGGSHAVSHAYFVVDLSLLRGDQRTDNLEKLVCAVTRAWLWMGQREDWSFGFSLFDSDVGGYMLSYQLNMVAQGMGEFLFIRRAVVCDE